MNHTPNYQLSQWAKSDQVRMEDFNADNAKIDAALAAHARTLAEHSAAIPKLAVGSYTGDNAVSRFISTGFTPKAVFVLPTKAYTYFDNYSNGGAVYAGLAVTGSSGCSADLPSVEIVTGGFKVFHSGDTRPLIRTNSTNEQYNYIALG